jgi:hypothetical protein
MDSRTIPILAAVTANEQVIVEAAAGHLADSLSRTAAEPWAVSATRVADLGAVLDVPAGSVIVTSLALALAPIERSWPDVEQELHRTYEALCATGNPVFICTLLRHVESEDDIEGADRIRRRLRQLNLLATELSRAYGALVIDLDRVLADVGARRLETDYRLGGKAAVELASNAVAVCVVANALDAFVPAEIQDAARLILESERPSVGLTTDQMMTNLMAMGQGRRKQRVATVTAEVQENHVGWLVRQVLKGQIGRREALDKLTGAVRRRGARESAWLLISGVARMARTQEVGRRP